LKARREPLREALRRFLELGPAGLQAYTKADRPEDYLEARYFTPATERAAAWREHGEAITAAWVAEHPGTRPWGWWQYAATAPRSCVEGVRHVWPVGSGDWVWRKEFGLPGRPQARKPGAEPARIVFEAQAAYLQRLGLLAPGEAERLTADDFEPEIVAIPELGARPTPQPAPALASRNGAPTRPTA
jgi:hypothetical protein